MSKQFLAEGVWGIVITVGSPQLQSRGFPRSRAKLTDSLSHKRRNFRNHSRLQGLDLTVGQWLLARDWINTL
jgi:hypothetical protein